MMTVAELRRLFLAPACSTAITRPQGPSVSTHTPQSTLNFLYQKGARSSLNCMIGYKRNQSLLTKKELQAQSIPR
ncbi:hypothetical protein BN77_p10207 [Rhizobium mesoamericanum STM3625]|uniref:Uncharacterized protein n=1 Tax=Rhizobium mesoamericanum STM3625 TaxID=1211777 RepID=K0Q2U0_9HYPH|nr:hypothetical protein BN77_p10207 [Rhizobium mesoamericanum STM3625]